MTTLMNAPTSIADRPRGGDTDRDHRTASEPAERLRTTMAACRVRFRWPGTSRALSAGQRALAAEAFDADAQRLSAAKKLLDTGHDAYRAVTAVRSRVQDYWRAGSLPYPEPGVRLLPRDRLEEFAARMTGLRAELELAAAALDRQYAALRDDARARLGSLYSEADYPPRLAALFGLTWDFPSVEPPAYLMALSPGLYEREQARVRGRFEQAVTLAEQAFTEELTGLVEHLAGRLSGTGPEGQVLVFRDSAVGHIQEFLTRFRALSVRSDPELEALVDRAGRLVRGVTARELRDSPPLRQRVAEGLERVRAGLDGLLVERPRRRVLRDVPDLEGRS